MNNLCKIVIVGESSVGKSSFLGRFNSREFSETQVSTIGYDVRCIEKRFNDRILKFQI